MEPSKAEEKTDGSSIVRASPPYSSKLCAFAACPTPTTNRLPCTNMR
jgi:hypothetical protein